MDDPRKSVVIDRALRSAIADSLGRGAERSAEDIIASCSRAFRATLPSTIGVSAGIAPRRSAAVREGAGALAIDGIGSGRLRSPVSCNIDNMALVVSTSTAAIDTGTRRRCHHDRPSIR